MTAPEPCGVASRHLTEEIAGTAPVVTEWLLVEDRSAWGPDAVADLRSRGETMAAMIDAAVGAGHRVLAVRRQSRGDEPLSVLRATSVGTPRVTFGTLDEATSLLAADPTAHLPTESGPLFLLCTHGRRDPCCTRWGKPAAIDLADDPAVWETSHVGGHRFAGNLVALPYGLYFGRVDRENAGGVITGVRDGTIPLEHFRGRSVWPRPAQAAEMFVRRAVGDDAIPGWRLVEHGQVGDSLWRSVFDTPGGVFAASVELVELPGEAYEGCFKEAPAPRSEFRALAVEAS